jgi:hypothetical protein
VSCPATNCATLGRAEKRCQHADRGRLPGAVRAEEPEHLAGRNRERHTGDGLDVTEANDQIVDEDSRRVRCERSAHIDRELLALGAQTPQPLWS